MKKNNKVKIFLVDDDAVTLKLMQIEFLQQTDFEVETYPTGEACIENLSHNPDLIVLDYHLDGIQKNAMNGMQTLDKIKPFHLSPHNPLPRGAYSQPQPQFCPARTTSQREYPCETP